MSDIEIIKPTLEPVTLTEARDHLRVDHTDEDAQISEWITAARQAAGQYMRHPMMLHTRELQLDCFPNSDVLPVSIALINVVSVNYLDTTGINQLLATSEYDIVTESNPGFILPSYEKVWPDVRVRPGAVKIRYTSGYQTRADVPGPVRAAILLMITDLYEYRHNRTEGSQGGLSGSAIDLMRYYRDVTY